MKTQARVKGTTIIILFTTYTIKSVGRVRKIVNPTKRVKYNGDYDRSN